MCKLTETVSVWTNPHRFKPDGVQALKEGSGHWDPPLIKKPFANDTPGKGTISFLQWSPLGISTTLRAYPAKQTQWHF